MRRLVVLRLANLTRHTDVNHLAKTPRYDFSCTFHVAEDDEEDGESDSESSEGEAKPAAAPAAVSAPAKKKALPKKKPQM